MKDKRFVAPNQMPRLSVPSLAHFAETPEVRTNEPHWSYDKNKNVQKKLRKDNRVLKLLGL